MNWNKVLNAARNTVNKNPINKTPSSEWKRKILLAEHSPIRKLRFEFTFESIKSWVSVHLVRHKIGIEHFVTTQRDDRTGQDRDSKSQDSKVSHEIDVNAQAVINISRKRLCLQSHKETREVWETFLENIKDSEPELRSVCVRECIYRGFCPEMKPCGYSETDYFQDKLKEYRGL